MGFQVGKYQDSPLLNAYATTKQLKQKDTELDQNQQKIDIDDAYKKGLITNQERQILLGEKTLKFDERKYDTTGADVDRANIDLTKASTSLTQAEAEFTAGVKTDKYTQDIASSKVSDLEAQARTTQHDATTNQINQTVSDAKVAAADKEKTKLLDLLKNDATDTLNDLFTLPDDISAADLITVDKDGNFQLDENFADSFGGTQNANTMRIDLIDGLAERHTNLTRNEISKLVGDNWDDIYGQNLNSQMYDLNQYLTQAWQGEYKNADTNGDGTVDVEESKEMNKRLSEFIGTNKDIRNILSPGMLASGINPELMQYNIAGENVNIAGDPANYERMRKLTEDFTWTMNPQTMQWEKKLNSEEALQEDSQGNQTIKKVNPNKLTKEEANLIAQTGVHEDGHNYSSLYKNDIKPSDVKQAQNIAIAINGDTTGRAFAKDDIDELKVFSKGGKLYISESDVWSDDALPLRVDTWRSGTPENIIYNREIQVKGDFGNGPIWMSLADLQGEAKNLRILFEN